MSEPELHTAEAHAVIAAELVACTLGHRHRPELRPRGKEAIDAMYVTDAGGNWSWLMRGEGIEPPTRGV